MDIGRIKFTNFGPYQGEYSIDLTPFKGKKVLITGINTLTPGVDSNGSGKTTIFNLVSWVLFGQTAKDEDTTDVINEDSTFCDGQVELLTDKGSIIILRKRTLSGDQTLDYWVDGIHKSLRTVTQTQNAVLALLGINIENTEYFQDFLNSTYISSGVIDTFASDATKTKDKIELIGRFLHLNIPDKAKEIAKEKVDKLKEELNIVLSRIIFLEKSLEGQKSTKDIELIIEVAKNEISRQEQILKGLSEDLKTSQKFNELKKQETQLTYTIDLTKKEYSNEEFRIDNEINLLKSKLDSLTTLFDKEKELLGRANGFTKQLQDTGDYFQTDLKQNTQLLSELKIQQQSIYDKLIKNSSNLTDLKAQVGKALACPYCLKSVLVISGKLEVFDLSIATEVLAKLENSKNELNIEHTKAVVKVETQSNTCEAIKDKIRELQRTKQLLDDTMNQLSEVQNQLVRIPEIENQYSIKKQLLQSTQVTYGSKIANLEQQLKQIILTISKTPKGKDPQEILNQQNQVNATITHCMIDVDANQRLLKQITNVQIDLVSTKEEEHILKINTEKYSFWVKGFDEIKRLTIESFLPEFQDYTNYLLGILEAGMTVQFSTLGAKKKGGSKLEFSINVCNSNGKFRKLKTYSQGERRRIAVCIALALKQLSKNKGYMAMDFSMLDEIIDNLDETGADEFFKLLEKTDDTEFIITHSSKFGIRFSNSIHIIRQESGVKIECNYE